MSGGGGQGISNAIFEDSLREFLKPVAKLLADASVTEIMINGPKEVFIEIKGKIHKTDCEFENEPALLAAVRNISQFVGKPISEREPIMDARLPDGSRICAVIPPCAKNGTSMAIRKFSKEKLGLKDLINFGAMSSDMARFLDLCVLLKRNILVSGGTGSGKTTLLNVLGSRIPGNERLLIIEDTSELQIKSNHVVRFETKHKDFEGKGEVTIRDLVKASLRLRPDRVIVGEVRGAEALDLVQAMNTGHDGSMGTLHANNPFQAMNRLETLCMIADTGVPAHVIRSQVAEAIHIIVQANRLRDGSRKITFISECLGVNHDKGIYIMRDLFAFKQTGMSPDGKILGAHEALGTMPSFREMIETSGVPYPLSVFNKKAA
ncbi:MAG: CpaF family protein [Bdellovibrionales bacterium]|nr:CpaF family protein [Bdellovibrionales bacterium]